ncbi:MAG: hypothetical protein HN732_23735 [Rhodospirillaceae bacterium]|nr:hypothetical protein [Rhodospirillaceae bacterium]
MLRFTARNYARILAAAATRKLPVYAHYGITHRCNLTCKMCGIWRYGKKDEELTLDQVDLLVLPTAPQAAFPFEQSPPPGQADFTQWANHGGCPAVSLPCGLSPDGLPLGLQLMARPLADGQLLALAEVIAPLLPALPGPDIQ